MIAPIAPRESKRQCERDELHRQANAMNFGSLLHVAVGLQAKALALLLLWLRIKHRQPRSFRLLLTTHSSALWMRFAELTDPTLTAEGACELLILLLLPLPFARVETRPPART